jgi:uncharacterized protein YjbI with pentapeptide repeats
LQGANLSDVKLQGAVLILADLRDADLSHARLQGVVLRSANLQGANLFGTQLQGAHMSGAQLQFAILGGTLLQGADLSRANLQFANLAGFTQLQGANLSGAQLQFAILRGVSLEGSNLKAAQLQSASLEGVQLKGADLRDAEIGGAYFSHGVFAATSLDLADVRNIDREPLTQNEYNKIINNLRPWPIPRTSNIGRADMLEQATGRWRCDAALRSCLTQCIEEKDVNMFEKQRTEFLVQLACKQSEIAKTLAEQAVERPSPLSPIMKKSRDVSYAPNGAKQSPCLRSTVSSMPGPNIMLAKALLEAGSQTQCGGVRALPEEFKSRLHGEAIQR